MIREIFLMISLVIPFYNCEGLVINTVSKVKEYMKNNTDMEFIAVNDGSTDSTLANLEDNKFTNMKIVSYTDNRGKGGAVKEGITAATGNKIIFTDADLAYGLAPVSEFVNALDKYDIAIGTRRNDSDISERYGIIRSISSKTFSFITHCILRLDINDTQCGFKGYRSSAAKKLFADLSVMGFGFDLEVLAKAKKSNMSLKQIPVKLLTNEKQSNVSLIRDGFRMIGDMITIRKNLK